MTEYQKAKEWWKLHEDGRRKMDAIAPCVDRGDCTKYDNRCDKPGWDCYAAPEQQHQ